jgi:hypothetical protein
MSLLKIHGGRRVAGIVEKGHIKEIVTSAFILDFWIQFFAM